MTGVAMQIAAETMADTDISIVAVSWFALSRPASGKTSMNRCFRTKCVVIGLLCGMLASVDARLLAQNPLRSNDQARVQNHLRPATDAVTLERASFLLDQGFGSLRRRDFETAEKSFEECVAIHRAIVGSEHPGTARGL